MLTKEAIAHMSRGNGAPRRSLQMFLDGRKFERKGRIARETVEYLMVGSVPAVPNPQPYVYRPMSGAIPGRRV